MRQAERFASIGISIACGVPLALLGGVVLRDLWHWFIVPLFPAPELTVIQAIGISFVVGFFQFRRSDGEPDNYIEHTFGTLFEGVIHYLLFWGFGAIWAHFL